MTGLQCSVACRRCVCEGSASRQKFTRCCWLEEALLLLFIYTKKSKTTVFFGPVADVLRRPARLIATPLRLTTAHKHTHLNQLFFSIFLKPLIIIDIYLVCDNDPIVAVLQLV